MVIWIIFFCTIGALKTWERYAESGFVAQLYTNIERGNSLMTLMKGHKLKHTVVSFRHGNGEKTFPYGWAASFRSLFYIIFCQNDKHETKNCCQYNISILFFLPMLIIPHLSWILQQACDRHALGFAFIKLYVVILVIVLHCLSPGISWLS